MVKLGVKKIKHIIVYDELSSFYIKKISCKEKKKENPANYPCSVHELGFNWADICMAGVIDVLGFGPWFLFFPRIMLGLDLFLVGCSSGPFCFLSDSFLFFSKNNVVGIGWLSMYVWCTMSQ